jgi:hypothetical protein
MNRRAIDCSVPIPRNARLHDWWIALNVAKKGKIVSLVVPTVLYRQHGSNAIGACRRVSPSPASLLAAVREFHRRLRADYATVRQILPDVSFWPWCLRYSRTLIDGQMRGAPGSVP